MNANKIVPNEIEDKIEQPIDQNDLETQTASTKEKGNNALSSMHYISSVFGIIMSCLTCGMFTLLPGHNILKEPEPYYWYV